MPISKPNAGRRLERARTVLLVALTATIVSLIVLAVYGLSPPGETTRRAREFVRVLGLETPSLVPSGRSLRNPAYASPAVDLRPTPLVPAFVPNPETLLFFTPKPDRALRR
jgi:hypothetical protein